MSETPSRRDYPVLCIEAACGARLYGPVKYCPYCGTEQISPAPPPELTDEAVKTPESDVILRQPDPISISRENDSTPATESEGEMRQSDAVTNPIEPEPSQESEHFAATLRDNLSSRRADEGPVSGGREVLWPARTAQPIWRYGAVGALVLLIGVAMAFLLIGREGPTTESTPPPPPRSERIAQPEIRIGDSYTYESINHTFPKLTNTAERSVISIDGGTVYVRSVDLDKGHIRHTYFDRSWNFLGSQTDSGDGANYSPALKYYDFPLFEGKAWAGDSTETNRKTGTTRRHEVQGRVLGREQVQIALGTFSAWKVELKTKMWDSGKLVEGTDVSWYVPEVRRSVKSEIKTLDGSGATKERKTVLLRAFRLADYASSQSTAKLPGGPESAVSPPNDAVPKPRMPAVVSAADLAEKIRIALNTENLSQIVVQATPDFTVTLEGLVCVEADSRRAERIARSFAETQSVSSSSLLVRSQRIAQLQSVLAREGMADVKVSLRPECSGLNVSGSVASESLRSQALLQVDLYADGLPVNDQIRLAARAAPPTVAAPIIAPRCGSATNLEGAVQRSLRNAGVVGLSAEVDDDCVVRLKGSLACANEASCASLKSQALALVRGHAEVKRVDETIFMVYDD